VTLRPTRAEDLDFVLAQERDPDNTPYIGHWTRAEHLAAIAAADREHWIIERLGDGARAGFLIAYDLRAAGHGVYVKRVAVVEKSRGLGRAALALFVARAFGELGSSHVWLNVRHANTRAQAVYRALGFVNLELEPAERKELARVSGGFGDTSHIMRLTRSAP
jgi:ribosomal protein S18 acetylase RimI-like enzyme